VNDPGRPFGDGFVPTNPPRQAEGVTAGKESSDHKTAGGGPAKQVVMRFLPSSADSPTRAVISPVVGKVQPDVLIVPELVEKALKAGRNASREPNEPVTFLRCERDEKGG
jgi:hypothetical protein